MHFQGKHASAKYYVNEKIVRMPSGGLLCRPYDEEDKQRFSDNKRKFCWITKFDQIQLLSWTGITSSDKNVNLLSIYPKMFFFATNSYWFFYFEDSFWYWSPMFSLALFTWWRADKKIFRPVFWEFFFIMLSFV